MKIAFLVGRFPVISETFILNQITGLIDAGHQVNIFARARPGGGQAHGEVESYGLLERTRYFHVPGGRVERVVGAARVLARMVRQGMARAMLPALDPRRAGRQAFTLRGVHLIHPLLERGPHDILHCHFGTVGLTGAQLKAMGVPGKLVVTFHGHDLSAYLTGRGAGVYDGLFRRADLLMPVSQYWRQKLVDAGADEAKILVHRMGINLEHFPFAPRFAAPGDEIRLLTVGRLVEKKGVAFALEALARLRARQPGWKIRYEVVGGGEQEGALRARIAGLGLEGTAFLLGPQPREVVMERMRAAHIFLQPSVTGAGGDQEGIPVSIMEAMAAGLPVLSTLHSGIPELVEDGASGFLVPEWDVEALAGCMERLAANPASWVEIGAAGRRMVEAHHDIRKLNARLEEAYRGLVGR